MPGGKNEATVDEGKLNAFVGQMQSDLGRASSIAMVRIDLSQEVGTGLGAQAGESSCVNSK